LRGAEILAIGRRRSFRPPGVFYARENQSSPEKWGGVACFQFRQSFAGDDAGKAASKRSSFDGLSFINVSISTDRNMVRQRCTLAGNTKKL